MKPLSDLLEQHPLPNVADASKQDKGNVVIVGGPAHCPGAAVLAATAALRTGAGRVQAAVDAAVAAAIGVAVPEAAVFAWPPTVSPPSDVARRLAQADVVLIGSGHHHLDEVVVRAAAERATEAALILDAGALGSARAVAGLRTVVVAPNPSEARELLDTTDGDEGALARAVAQRLGGAAAVRGEATAVSDGHECWSLADMPAGLGTPGSGDVFMGALAALLASGLAPVVALGWTAQLHAAAGRRLAEATPVGYLARDLVAELPFAWAEA